MYINYIGNHICPCVAGTSEWSWQTTNARRSSGQLDIWLVNHRVAMGIILGNQEIKNPANAGFLFLHLDIQVRVLFQLFNPVL